MADCCVVPGQNDCPTGCLLYCCDTDKYMCAPADVCSGEQGCSPGSGLPPGRTATPIIPVECEEERKVLVRADDSEMYYVDESTVSDLPVVEVEGLPA